MGGAAAAGGVTTDTSDTPASPASTFFTFGIAASAALTAALGCGSRKEASPSPPRGGDGCSDRGPGPVIRRQVRRACDAGGMGHAAKAPKAVGPAVQGCNKDQFPS